MPSCLLALSTGLALLLTGLAAAQDQAKCLDCHEVSQLEESVHAKHRCLDCHRDLKGQDLPHETPGTVDCAVCHEGTAREYSGSLHAQALEHEDELAPRCQNCHGAHDIRPGTDPRSRTAPMHIPFMCGSCHKEGAPAQKQRVIHQSRILGNYSESMHAEALLKKGLTVSANCASCHTAHSILPHTDPKSSIARKNVTKTCMQCHSAIENVHRKVIAGKLWEKDPHVIPVCVDCHQPHKARKVFYDQGMADRDCLTCHGRQDLRRKKDGKSIYVNTKHVGKSVHGKTACAKCHTGLTPSSTRPCETVTPKVDCSICHSDQVDRYEGGIHGKLRLKGDPNAPACADCHGTHRVTSKRDENSHTFPINVPDLCAKCHREGEKAAVRYRGEQHDISKHYRESIHGKGLLSSGLVVTAMCTNCHTAHSVLPLADPASSVNKKNVARTCAKCHKGVYNQHITSVHSPGISKTDKELPGCSDCHTAHTINRIDQEGFRTGIMAKCGRCHRETAETYFDTYHGKVSRLGYGKTAKCHDCHGAHDILPTSNPKSRLSRQNAVETCKTCHPGATKQFAGYFTHATHHDAKKYPWLFLSFWGMTALLVGTFGVFALHTVLWFPRSLRMRREHPVSPAGEKDRQFERFTPLERILHVGMIVSFIGLAVTGMTLKFSYTTWAAIISRALGGFEGTGLIHRFFAIIMFGVFFMHLYSIWRRNGWDMEKWKAMLTGPSTMLFTRRDLKELGATLKWFLGIGPRPAYGKWTYWEKFDYFAVFWGIAIIGSTGLVLWFAEAFTIILPGWVINVATIIHSDEALLATGFIFTFHFFNTHFRPDKFPMDTVIFTGQVPLSELRHDRPEQYRQLDASGELKKSLVPPASPDLIKAARVFGFLALGAGLAMVIAIIYAMVFAYR